MVRVPKSSRWAELNGIIPNNYPLNPIFERRENKKPKIISLPNIKNDVLLVNLFMQIRICIWG